MKTIFLSFADSRMTPTLNRIKRQAKKMGVFDEIIVINEKQLDKGFRKKYKDRLQLGSRGYGYWIWKPYIIKELLNKMNDGDRLLYIDAGCHLNSNGCKRLNEYFQAVSESELKVGGFKLSDINNDRTWTKMDLLDYFKVQINNDIINSGQIAATQVILIKCSETVEFVNEWMRICENLHMIDDSPSLLPNFPEFREHRHDQSVFSLLCKTKKAVVFSGAECYTTKGWETLKDYPIWDMRDKRLSLTLRCKSFFKKVLKKIQKLRVGIIRAYADKV